MRTFASTMLAAAGLLLATAPVAMAAPYWSAISTGCVPDNTSIQANRYQPLSDSAIKHRGTNVDRIVLYCAVQPNAGASNPNVISMTYLDATGAGPQAYVKAELIAISRASGVRVVVGTFNSNSSAVTTVTQKGALFFHPLNFDSNYYLVRIEMDRAAAAQAVRAIGVALDYAL
jgi:hypothetical protein